MECHETDEDVMRVFVPGASDRVARISSGLRAGENHGAQVHLERACPRSDGRDRRAASPIHDQSRRRSGTGARAVRQVIAGTGIRSMLSRKWFLGLLMAPVHSSCAPSNLRGDDVSDGRALAR